MIAIVAERPAACLARVERIAPGPHSAAAASSGAVAAAAALAEAATPSASPAAGLDAGDAATFGSPATDVATTAGELADAPAAPFGAGDGLATGFAAAEAVGEGAAVGFETIGLAAGLPFAAVACPDEGGSFAVGPATVVGVAVGAAVSVCDCGAGMQPASSRPIASAESRAARGTGGWYRARSPSNARS